MREQGKETSDKPKDKGEISRQRLLDAAAECFRREGFNGASVGRIAQEAGMSPGHIYHFFTNKEAIVEAIAEREEHNLTELLQGVVQRQDGESLGDILIHQSDTMVRRSMDARHTSLTLELAAEATRNAAVRETLQRSDREIALRFFQQVKRLEKPVPLDDSELGLRLQIIAALHEGLMLRFVYNPELESDAITRLFNKVIRILLLEATDTPKVPSD